jgi:Zn finger protein HypA/HybF involved in hydrogenase expression
MFKNRILFLFTLLFIGNTINAQETTLEKGKEYTLSGIEVTGKVSFNEQTIITFTGLEIGSKIRIPGDEISLAITKLWKLGLFNDVNFYVKKIEGEEMNHCPDCNTEMDLISTSAEAGLTKGFTTHFMLEEPYYKCPKCKIEVESEG